MGRVESEETLLTWRVKLNSMVKVGGGGVGVGCNTVCLYEPWLAPRHCRCGIIWFSSSCVRPLWPCVHLLRVSCGRGVHGAGCGGGVCTGVIAGLKKTKTKNSSSFSAPRILVWSLTSSWQKDKSNEWWRVETWPLTLRTDDPGSLPGPIGPAAGGGDVALKEAFGALVADHRVDVIMRPPPADQMGVLHGGRGPAQHCGGWSYSDVWSMWWWCDTLSVSKCRDRRCVLPLGGRIQLSGSECVWVSIGRTWRNSSEESHIMFVRTVL